METEISKEFLGEPRKDILKHIMMRNILSLKEKNILIKEKI